MTDPDGQSIIIQLLLLLVLTLINAFFAAAEMALVQVNQSRLEQKSEDGDKTAKLLVKILNEPTNFLSTIQVGITLVTLLSGASLAHSIAQVIASLFGGGQLALQISQIIAMVILTYVSIVFGELYPKRIAMNRPYEVARFSVYPLKILSVIAKPFVWLLSASTDFLSRVTPMDFDDKEEKMTREEMCYLLKNEGQGVLDHEEIEMVQGVMSLDSMVAREVMVPRPDMFMIDIEDGIEENLAKILGENFSRIPVYKEDKDKVIGIVHTKQLLNAAYQVGFKTLDFTSVMQEPLFVPETIFADDLLYEFKKTQNQMAILLDEYGSTVGLVTLEDLLEEIVGDIEDETDEVDQLYEEISPNTYLIQGKMTINEFNETFDQKLEMNDVDTMAGYLITSLGVIPEKGQHLSLTLKHCVLSTEKVEDSRIQLIKVQFKQSKEEVKED